MTVRAESISLQIPRVPQDGCPAPVSLETLAVVEQVIAQALHALRDKATQSARNDAAAIEYASWLRSRH